MTLTLELNDNKEAALEARAREHGLSAEQFVQQMLDRELEEPGRNQSVSAMVREIWSDLPDDARAKLPTDGADQVDHYVYGVPKRDQ